MSPRDHCQESAFGRGCGVSVCPSRHRDEFRPIPILATIITNTTPILQVLLLASSSSAITITGASEWFLPLLWVSVAPVLPVADFDVALRGNSLS